MPTKPVTQPRDGSWVEPAAFRPDDDGYLWCTTPQAGGVFLSNHTSPEDRLYLTPGEAGAPLRVTPIGPGIPRRSGI